MRTIFCLLAGLAVVAAAGPPRLAAQSHAAFRDVSNLRLSGRVPAQVDSLLDIERFLTPYLASHDPPPCHPVRKSAPIRRFMLPLPGQEEGVHILVVWHDPHPEPQPQGVNVRRNLEDGRQVEIGLMLGELAYVVFEGEEEGERTRNILVLAPSSGLADRLEALARQVMQVKCR